MHAVLYVRSACEKTRRIYESQGGGLVSLPGTNQMLGFMQIGYFPTKLSSLASQLLSSSPPVYIHTDITIFPELEDSYSSQTFREFGMFLRFRRGSRNADTQNKNFK